MFKYILFWAFLYFVGFAIVGCNRCDVNQQKSPEGHNLLLSFVEVMESLAKFGAPDIYERALNEIKTKLDEEKAKVPEDYFIRFSALLEIALKIPGKNEEDIETLKSFVYRVTGSEPEEAESYGLDVLGCPMFEEVINLHLLLDRSKDRAGAWKQYHPKAMERFVEQGGNVNNSSCEFK